MPSVAPNPAPRGAPRDAPLAAPGIHLHAAALRYGGRVVFDALDLELPGGRTTCLLGPSGVGKTSLLRLIAGLAPDPPQGTKGDVVDETGRPVAGRIAYLAQRDLLLPWLSVLGNVTLGYRLRGEMRGRPGGRPGGGPGGEPVETRARELLARVGLAARAEDLPARLSGGERQRVALARTLMEDRPVVLMDEPFSALDAITRFELQALAAELLAGRTVLLVTHDPLEALRLGHRVQVMAQENAASPARLDEALEPAGAPPRDPADPALLAQQAELLKRLIRAKEAAA
ncbi:MAG: ABC transporter ATP-binding protein [Alphaproteobacteria bacterium]